MEPAMGAEALRAWDAARRRLQGRQRGPTVARRRSGDDGLPPSRDATVLIGTAPPALLTADMRTGSLAAGRLSMWNGYGAAQHVRRKKEDGR